MISVILPTRNPHPGRLHRTLAGLAAQSLARAHWELLIVDNGSEPALATVGEPLLSALGARLVTEPEPGLTSARLAGICAAGGDILVFVDDDNVLAATYLASVAERFAAAPALAAASGPVVPEWETPPPAWTREFHGLLALRDLGPEPRLARGGPGTPWPDFAPVGAGLAIKRSHALAYADAVARDPRRLALDRTGACLASGGDNDLVFTALHAGGNVAYFPELRLTHLIPAGRLDAVYLARLNRGIMRTWVRVLALHGQFPWPRIAPATVPLRVARAWVRLRAWRGPAEKVRWAGARGQFEGQAEIDTRPSGADR
ncbi:MAG: glycosyltransferase [Verrucomicrobia bacterium]|nr:glycosyltransferase [Verrucomicrobiota bacterium]